MSSDEEYDYPSSDEIEMSSEDEYEYVSIKPSDIVKENNAKSQEQKDEENNKE